MLTLGAGAAGAGGSMGILIFIVIMFVGMYFISIRPQKKQQQKRQEMLKDMQVGDNVVTLGGLKGVIHEINRDNKEIVIDCDGVYLTFDLNFIRRSSRDGKVANDARNEQPAAEAKPAETEEAKDATEAPAEEPKAEAKADDATETAADDAAKDDTKDETK